MYGRSKNVVGAIVLLVAASVAGCAGGGDRADRADRPGVIVSFSHSTPDTAYWRRFAPWIQKRPFDGVVIEIDPRDATWIEDDYWQQQIEWTKSRSPEYDYLAEMYRRPREQGSLSWAGGGSLTQSGATSPWSPGSRYTDATLAKALEDMQAAPAADRFHFNLLGMGVQSPTTDWYNDEQWEQRLRNYVVLARFAKAAGFKGFLFDDEQYGSGCAWSYPILRKRGATHGHSFTEMRAKARERGRAIGQAICAEFPDMVFWTLHGYGTTASHIENGLPDAAMDLKTGFYDGLLEGSTDEFVFVDGGEMAYGYHRREHFESGRKMVKEEPIRMGLTKVPDLHRSKVKCAFGLWPDYYGALDPDDPENSYFSPGRFQRALNLALELSDGYVWFWGEKWSWWVEGPHDRAPVPIHQGRRGLPLAYWRAVEAARTSAGDDTSDIRRLPTVMLPTNGRNGVIEGEKLTELLSRSQKVYELPTEGWTFKLDDWGSRTDDAATWDRPITIGKSWRDQGVTGDGKVGWYRLDFDIPKNLEGRKLHFYLPDVDGSIWLSSLKCPRPQEMSHRYVGLEPDALRKPFAMTHPEFASFFWEPGKPALVVIKVMRHGENGGIMAPIQIIAE